MESISSEQRNVKQKLRAMVEVIDGKLAWFPIAESDEQAEAILKALSEAGKR